MVRKTLKLNIIFALACSILTWGNSIGSVLCFGKDGHIAIEPGQDFVCSATTPTVTKINYEISTNDTSPSIGGHCGPCIDVPIFLHTQGKDPVVSREFSLLTQPESLNFSFQPAEKLVSSNACNTSPDISRHTIISTPIFLQNAVLII